jgi:membrane associated rhomboid family serine protease
MPIVIGMEPPACYTPDRVPCHAKGRLNYSYSQRNLSTLTNVFWAKLQLRINFYKISDSLMHSNVSHICGNALFQVFYGIPMEMVHGTKTMVALYFFGAITGSLGVSVFDSEVSFFCFISPNALLTFLNGH